MMATLTIMKMMTFMCSVLCSAHFLFAHLVQYLSVLKVNVNMRSFGMSEEFIWFLGNKCLCHDVFIVKR